MNEPIDFVITWVDGSDPEWRKERARYSPGSDTDDSECRYRNWDLLRYWFRGVEKFAPWARKIHFITWGHLPDWLNTENPKLNIVRHEDYIPNEFLPVFSSCVLEIYIDRIAGLADHFVYFNDDVFLLNNVKPEMFFADGIPCDMLALQPVVANRDNPVMSYIYLNTSLILSKYFDKRENMKKHPGNYFHLGYPPKYFFYNIIEMLYPRFTGFYTVHGASAFCKKTFREVWEREEEYLKDISKNKFRSKNDIMQYLFREWQKLSGNFKPRNIHGDFSFYSVGERNEKLIKTIRGGKKRIICINDDYKGANTEKIEKEISDAFDAVLPNRSSYEKY